MDVPVQALLHNGQLVVTTMASVAEYPDQTELFTFAGDSSDLVTAVGATNTVWGLPPV